MFKVRFKTTWKEKNINEKVELDYFEGYLTYFMGIVKSGKSLHTNTHFVGKV
jgi:hypothetical protein